MYIYTYICMFAVVYSILKRRPYLSHCLLSLSNSVQQNIYLYSFKCIYIYNIYILKYSKPSTSTVPYHVYTYMYVCITKPPPALTLLSPFCAPTSTRSSSSSSLAIATEPHLILYWDTRI